MFEPTYGNYIYKEFNMKLYLVHAGFYNPEIMGGLYEQHNNFFVVAVDLKDAKKKAQQNAIFKKASSIRLF